MKVRQKNKKVLLILNTIIISIITLLGMIVSSNATFKLHYEGADKTVDGTITTTADLANFAEENGLSFRNVDVKSLLHKTMTPGGGKKYSRSSDIDFKTSGCFYHRQSNLPRGGTDKIVAVIDIDTYDKIPNYYINGEKQEYDTGTDNDTKKKVRNQQVTLVKLAAAAYNACTAKETGETGKKGALRNIIFGKIAKSMFNKGVMKEFFTKDENGVPLSQSKYQDAVDDVQDAKYLPMYKYGDNPDGQNIYEGNDGKQYIGPFKVRYEYDDDVEVRDLTLTIDGKDYTINEHYRSNDAKTSFAKQKGDVESTKSFFVQVPEGIDLKDGSEHKWGLLLKTSDNIMGYRARLLMISNPDAKGQNLMMWSANRKKTYHKVEWGAKTQGENEYKIVLIKEDSKTGNKIKKTVKFTVNGTEKSTSNGELTIASGIKINKDNVNKDDTYVIKEIQAPSKYKILADSFTVTVKKEKNGNKYQVASVNISGGNGAVTQDKSGNTITIHVKNEPEEAPPEAGAGIKKLDDRTGEPLENIEFSFMTHIYTYDIISSHTHTFQIKIYDPEQYTYTIPYTYTVNGETKTGYYGPYTATRYVWKGRTYTSSHTHNICKYMKHEAYLSKRNTWVVDGKDTHKTDLNGIAYGYGPIDESCNHRIYNDVTETGCSHPSGPFDSAPICGETNYKLAYFDPDDTSVTATEENVPILEPTEGNPLPNPEAEYYGYTENIGKQWKFERDSTQLTIAQNHQHRIMVSGFVWLEQEEGKMSVRNNSYDGSETGINGITVYLMQGSSVVDYTTTKEIGIYSEINGGEYRFYNVNLDALEAGAYHIEFEYCGVQYQSVAPMIEDDMGSKATDDTSDPNYSRTAINEKFATVNGTSNKDDQTITASSVSLTYDGCSGHKSELQQHIEGNQYRKLEDKHRGCEVRAATGSPTGYYLENHFSTPQKEIRYVNCGLFKKVQTNYALAQDLYKVNVGVNGFQHVYRYATVRYTNDGNDIIDDDSTWNGGVKFQKNDGSYYERAIYKADYEYIDNEKKGENSREITVYLTYKITLKNEGVYTARINSIVDYYDSNYEYVTSGYEIDENGDAISDTIGASGPENAENGFKKHTIYPNRDTINPGEKLTFYVKFKMNKDAVINVMNAGSTKNNVAEINSYTTYDDDETPIAVYDVDSVLNSAKPGEIETYEDDTDAARSLKLVFKEAREISGTAFVDNTGKNSDTIYTNQERRGNGIYNANEDQVIKDVKVQLIDLSTGQVAQLYDDDKNIYYNAETKTDENGNYNFKGFKAGDYQIQFTWGKGYDNHKVQYYKATIYNANRYTKTMSDPYWYRGNDFYDSNNGDTATWDDDTNSWTIRYNDALDDHSTRTKIDNEMAAITTNIVENEINKAYNGTSEKIKTTTMTSTTPKISYSVEYDTNVTYGYQQGNDQATDRVTFGTLNIDFGIAERPKQELDLTKRITGYNITLSNGQTLVNAKVDENGKISGTYPYTIDQAPTRQQNKGRYIDTYNGLIKTEMDNELIEGAKLETVYTIRVTNIGEKDYTTWNYYDFGIQDENNVVTVDTTELTDYVDGRLQVLDDKWKITDEQHLKDVNASIKTTATLKELKPYLTEKLSKALKPTESNTVTLTTSKLLTSTEDNEFNNTSEITQTKKPNGDVKGTPVHVTWNSDSSYNFNKASSQTVTILPSTGENKDYTTPILVAIIAITTLGIGILLIIKYTTDKKNKN